MVGPPGRLLILPTPVTGPILRGASWKDPDSDCFLIFGETLENYLAANGPSRRNAIDIGHALSAQTVVEVQRAVAGGAGGVREDSGSLALSEERGNGRQRGIEDIPVGLRVKGKRSGSDDPPRTHESGPQDGGQMDCLNDRPTPRVNYPVRLERTPAGWNGPTGLFG
jgi:hypothetical protein